MSDDDFLDHRQDMRDEADGLLADELTHTPTHDPQLPEGDHADDRPT